jgi:hypothetical protein
MTQTTALTPVTYELRGRLQNPDFVKRVVGCYPMRRLGEPMATASWITAQTYPVNGGYSVAQ